MRNRAEGTCLVARAIAGAYVVTLAWDFASDDPALRQDLSGFALERSEFDAAGNVVERYWLRGIKRFKDKDKGLPPGSPVPTSEHPVQAFQWGDYTVRPGVRYRYRIVPVYGPPLRLTLADDRATPIEVTTELEAAPREDGKTAHEIYFNRGVAGSQAYVREFGKVQPDPADPTTPQMRWLSRGLYEALVNFIGLATDAGFGLRGMFYEFHYQPVGEALKAAAGRGADVRVRYEAQTFKDQNELMIAASGIGGFCQPQMVRPGIRHNKFLVLLQDGAPKAVWTGSTNISAGGIFGHSNVGHVVWDSGVAQRYLDYWNVLAAHEVDTASLRERNLQVEPTPQGTPPSDRILTLFSPRESRKPSGTLAWYADRLGSATSIACMTFAFNFDPVFEAVAKGDTDSLNYLLFDKKLSDAVETEVTHNGNSIVAAGAILKAGDLETFLGEVLTGFNSNRYIHDKILLVDPLSEDPVVISGTANFSQNSQIDNDENMLVIRGDQRVADIYFGEFMRIFDHLYARYVIRRIVDSGTNDPDAGYLKIQSQDWLPAHFKPGGIKDRRRRAFMA